MLLNKLTVGLAALFVLSVAHSSTQAGVILDQNNVISNPLAAYRGGNTAEFSQTFTVGVTGSLVKISLEVGEVGTDLTITLLRTTNGVPDPNKIAAALIVPGTLFPADEFTPILTDINLGASAFAVTTGDVLAIALSAPGGFGVFTWATDVHNPYPNGEAYGRSSPDPYQPAVDLDNNPGNTDNGFRTYVDNSPSTISPVPEPSTRVMFSILLGIFGATWCCKRLK
jgi:hypothetical protein